MNQSITKELKRSVIIGQLSRHNYTDVEGKTDEELLKILSYYRVNVEADANRFF